jgi:hypothetical protein
VIRALLVAAGYWIRPYDLVADRRHWRWQHPAPCGRQAWADLTDEQRDAIEAAVIAQLLKTTADAQRTLDQLAELADPDERRNPR